jgi:hypothetical protein
VATYLLAATAKLHGLPGFGEGIQFLVQFVEKYWAVLFSGVLDDFIFDKV